MIPIKIQCGCGQKYAFEVEPVDGRLANTVACPVCGADGTAAANAAIAQALVVRPQQEPSSGLRLSAAAPAAPVPRPRISPVSPMRPTIRPVQTSTKLVWYEMLWIALPIGLVGVGGAIGGACGGAAWAINKKVFKEIENPALRYLVTGAISVSAVVVWLVIAGVFLSLFRRH